MPNSEIFLLLPHEKDIAAMQQSESVLVPSKPDSPRSLLFPDHQENQSKRQGNHKQQDQGQEEEEQDNLQGRSILGRSRGKRKRECNDDEASCVEIQETPRKSNSGCYCLPRPPRKPKATPAIKRRAMWVKRSVALLDVAREVESMFPPSVLQDLGKKIKKARS